MDAAEQSAHSWTGGMSCEKYEIALVTCSVIRQAMLRTWGVPTQSLHQSKALLPAFRNSWDEICSAYIHIPCQYDSVVALLGLVSR